jgi:hypothetical protein
MENNEVKETGLVLANTTAINTDVFGGSKAKRLTSLDLNDEEQQNMFLNAMQEADFKLNDCVGQVINVIAATIGEYPNETTNEETGEVIIRKKHSLCLFDENGNSYVTGSGSCYYSFVNIVALKGMPTKEKPYKLEIVKVEAETKGHHYLKVKIAK